MTDYREILQGTEEWLKARLGCLTASRANDACAAETTAAYQNYLWQLVAEREAVQAKQAAEQQERLKAHLSHEAERLKHFKSKHKSRFD